jgi:predicted nucleic acid-binding Zn ribbon protein
MLAQYRDWIIANVRGTDYGEWREVTARMLAAFPELRRVPGHYHCPFIGPRTHWWLVDADGGIVDPTVDQFPSRGLGEYVEWDGSPLPTGRCLECGGDVYDGSSFCSDQCGEICTGEFNRLATSFFK